MTENLVPHGEGGLLCLENLGMPPSTRLVSIILLLPVVCLDTVPVNCALGQTTKDLAGEASVSVADQPAETKREERREFQLQELMLAKSGNWIFKPGETPRIVWRDVETVRRLGCDEPFHVRWFDAGLNESPEPNTPGRWLAWIEGTAPNGTPLRRSRTFYGLPKQIPTTFSPDLTVALPNFFGPKAPAAVSEREAEILRLANDILVQVVLGSDLQTASGEIHRRYAGANRGLQQA